MTKKVLAVLLSLSIGGTSWAYQGQVDEIIANCSKVSKDNSHPVLNFALILTEVGVAGVGLAMINFGWGKPSYTQDDLSVPTGVTVTSAAIATEVKRRNWNLLGEFDVNELKSLALDFTTGTTGTEVTKIKSACKKAYNAGLKVDCDSVINQVKEKLMSGELCSRDDISAEVQDAINEAN